MRSDNKKFSTNVDLFFRQVESVGHETGKLIFKLPKKTMAKIEQLCRLELEKEIDGSDREGQPPSKLSLAERIEEVEKVVSYYEEQLRPGNWKRWKLNDLSFFEYRLEETKKELEKLKKRERFLKHSRQKENINVRAIKEANDLVEVARSYGLQLIRRRNEFWAKCPFHQEKTPSFSINQKKQVFHCFGCEESGDLIDFVMKMEGCDFLRAIEVLK